MFRFFPHCLLDTLLRSPSGKIKMFLMGIRSMYSSYVPLGLYTTLYFQAFVSHYRENKEKLDAAHLRKAAQIVCNIMRIIHRKTTGHISLQFLRVF